MTNEEYQLDLRVAEQIKQIASTKNYMSLFAEMPNAEKLRKYAYKHPESGYQLKLAYSKLTKSEKDRIAHSINAGCSSIPTREQLYAQLGGKPTDLNLEHEITYDPSLLQEQVLPAVRESTNVSAVEPVRPLQRVFLDPLKMLLDRTTSLTEEQEAQNPDDVFPKFGPEKYAPDYVKENPETFALLSSAPVPIRTLNDYKSIPVLEENQLAFGPGFLAYFGTRYNLGLYGNMDLKQAENLASSLYRQLLPKFQSWLDSQDIRSLMQDLKYNSIVNPEERYQSVINDLAIKYFSSLNSQSSALDFSQYAKNYLLLYGDLINPDLLPSNHKELFQRIAQATNPHQILSSLSKEDRDKLEHIISTLHLDFNNGVGIEAPASSFAGENFHLSNFQDYEKYKQSDPNFYKLLIAGWYRDSPNKHASTAYDQYQVDKKSGSSPTPGTIPGGVSFEEYYNICDKLGYLPEADEQTKREVALENYKNGAYIVDLAIIPNGESFLYGAGAGLAQAAQNKADGYRLGHTSSAQELLGYRGARKPYELTAMAGIAAPIVGVGIGYAMSNPAGAAKLVGSMIAGHYAGKTVDELLASHGVPDDKWWRKALVEAAELAGYTLAGGAGFFVKAGTGLLKAGTTKAMPQLLRMTGDYMLQDFAGNVTGDLLAHGWNAAGDYFFGEPTSWLRSAGRTAMDFGLWGIGHQYGSNFMKRRFNDSHLHNVSDKAQAVLAPYRYQTYVTSQTFGITPDVLKKHELGKEYKESVKIVDDLSKKINLTDQEKRKLVQLLQKKQIDENTQKAIEDITARKKLAGKNTDPWELDFLKSQKKYGLSEEESKELVTLLQKSGLSELEQQLFRDKFLFVLQSKRRSNILQRITRLKNESSSIKQNNAEDFNSVFSEYEKFTGQRSIKGKTKQQEALLWNRDRYLQGTPEWEKANALYNSYLRLNEIPKIIKKIEFLNTYGLNTAFDLGNSNILQNEILSNIGARTLRNGYDFLSVAPVGFAVGTADYFVPEEVKENNPYLYAVSQIMLLHKLHNWSARHKQKMGFAFDLKSGLNQSPSGVLKFLSKNNLRTFSPEEWNVVKNTGKWRIFNELTNTRTDGRIVAKMNGSKGEILWNNAYEFLTGQYDPYLAVGTYYSSPKASQVTAHYGSYTDRMDENISLLEYAFGNSLGKYKPKFFTVGKSKNPFTAGDSRYKPDTKFIIQLHPSYVALEKYYKKVFGQGIKLGEVKGEARDLVLDTKINTPNGERRLTLNLLGHLYAEVLTPDGRPTGYTVYCDTRGYGSAATRTDSETKGSRVKNIATSSIKKFMEEGKQNTQLWYAIKTRHPGGHYQNEVATDFSMLNKLK